jgi:hypothetical protein
MRKWSKTFFFLALPVFLIACGGTSTSPTQPSTLPAQPSNGGMSVTARSYLDEILGIMQANSINRYTIDWTSFRQSVYAWVPNAQSIEDVTRSSAIPTALSLLGDHHSFYAKSNGTSIYNPNSRGSCSDPTPPGVEVPATIGYVKVAAFSGTGDAQVEFAVSIQNHIRSADTTDVLGWIVDLRGNGGGNMWPMVAGIGPILGEGTAGAFIDPNSNVTRWGYTNGASTIAGAPTVQVLSAYQLLRPSPKVAVLTNCGVVSSGEAVVVAFRGRANTRSFGTPTYGLSTANQSYHLSDGAWLYLTVAVMADRNLTP